MRGSSSFFGKQGRGASVQDQINQRLPGIRDRFHASHFLAYFQSYTNTYADLNYLRDIYTAALAVEGIRGLCIGTRPDCIPDAVIDLLEELAQTTYVSLELGVQSFENASLDWLARGHDRACSIDALERLAARAPHVHVCVHLILGSPTDSAQHEIDAAAILNSTGVKGVKLHQLMVLEHTVLARRFRETPFPVLSLEEYGKRVVDCINHLDPSIYLERLCATATHSAECIAPEWSRNRWQPHNDLRQLLEDLNCQQGSLTQPNTMPGLTPVPYAHTVLKNPATLYS